MTSAPLGRIRPTDPREDCVVLGHGGGGRLTQELLDDVFLPAFGNPLLLRRHDGAIIDGAVIDGEVAGRSLAFTTDSYVVHPHVFPGGDIGSLAVTGTANDLAMCGARPRWLSAGFILEEGLPISLLRRVVESMARTARDIGAEIVTGDTKVVGRGSGDGIFINTAGIGSIECQPVPDPAAVRVNDDVIVSGDLGRHGIAVLAAREGLELDGELASDCGSLVEPALALLTAGLGVRCVRDLTRGGLASSLIEIAETAGAHIDVEECAIPIGAEVRGACEILGLDPLYVANEGRFVAFVDPEHTERVLTLLHRHAITAGAARVGRVVEGEAGVTLDTAIGGRRIVHLLSGEQLPRIC